MYCEYFFNEKTGELKYSSSPKNNPSGIEWIKLSELEFRRFERAIEYAMLVTIK